MYSPSPIPHIQKPQSLIGVIWLHGLKKSTPASTGTNSFSYCSHNNNGFCFSPYWCKSDTTQKSQPFPVSLQGNFTTHQYTIHYPHHTQKQSNQILKNTHINPPLIIFYLKFLNLRKRAHGTYSYKSRRHPKQIPPHRGPFCPGTFITTPHLGHW